MIAQTKLAENSLWEYKWRPNTIDECVLPQRMKNYFNGIITSGKLQNLLLASQKPGTGKTTVAHALVNQLGYDVMFINASVENGINLVRHTIPDYCRQQSLSGKPKAIILDEADNLSVDAQKALRGCIDEYSSNCRFILTCNHKQKLSEPIQSRFNVVEFVYNEDEVKDCIRQAVVYNVNILKSENIQLSSPKVILELVKQNYPNNRNVVLALQHYSTGGRAIDEGVLAEIQNTADISVLVDAIKNKQFKIIRENAGNFGDNADTLIGTLYEELLTKIAPSSIPDLVEAIGTSNRAMPTVVSKEIELTYLLTQLMCTLTFK